MIANYKASLVRGVFIDGLIGDPEEAEEFLKNPHVVTIMVYKHCPDWDYGSFRGDEFHPEWVFTGCIKKGGLMHFTRSEFPRNNR
jgi:hypothetical protein